MESQSQNPNSSTESSSSAQSSQATGTAGKSTPKNTSRTESAGIEQVSGVNAIESPEQAMGHAKQLDELNPQTGAAGNAQAALSSQDTPVRTGQQGSNATPEWQTALQATLKNSWTSVAARIRTASPTQIALGAAAVGAAVWLGTRKRGAKADARKQQSSADRWSDYPSGSDGSRSEGQYGRYSSQASDQEYDTQRQGSRIVRQSGELPAGSQSTSGPASGAYGQSGETWQRPADERWDD